MGLLAPHFSPVVALCGKGKSAREVGKLELF